nr:hypothetical protein [Nocardioides humi]
MPTVMPSATAAETEAASVTRDRRTGAVTASPSEPLGAVGVPVVGAEPARVAEDRLAAVDGDAGAGDERRVATEQECDQGGHVAGLPQAADRCVGKQEPTMSGAVGALQHRRRHTRLDHPRHHAVDPDPMAPQLRRHTGREHPQARLGRAVGREQVSVLARARRGVDDDRASGARRDHALGHRLADVEGAGEVDRDVALPLPLRLLEERRELPVARVGEEPVDAAEPLGHRGDPLVDRLTPGLVDAEREHAAAAVDLTAPGDRLIEELGQPVEDGHLGSLARDHHRELLTDVSGSTRDQHGATCEATHCAVYPPSTWMMAPVT